MSRHYQSHPKESLELSNQTQIDRVISMINLTQTDLLRFLNYYRLKDINALTKHKAHDAINKLNHKISRT